MKEMKRILSMVLCLVMVLGLMPVAALNASAVEETAGGDAVSQDAPTLYAGDESSTAEGEYDIPIAPPKIIYELTDNPEEKQQYLIVNKNNAGIGVAVARDENGVSALSVEVRNVYDNIYIELENDTTALWNVGGSNPYTFENQGAFLCYDNGLKVDSTATNWTYNTKQLDCGNNSHIYLRYNREAWGTNNRQATPVYFYLKTELPAETESVQGTFEITATSPLTAAVVQNEDGTCASFKDLPVVVTFTPERGDKIELVDLDYEENGNVACFIVEDEDKIISEIEDGTVYFTGSHGTAKVRVAYTLPNSETEIVTYVEVEATAPYYSLDLHKQITDANGNPAAGDLIGDDEIIQVKGIEDGATYSVWAVIKKCDGVIDESDNGTVDGEHIDSAGDQIEWESSDTDIAEVNSETGTITFKGKEGVVRITATYTDGVDANGNHPSDTITISATPTQYMVPSDGTLDFPEYHEPGAIRFDKTAEAVGNFSQTGVAQMELSMTGIPFSGKGTDVIIMLDTSSSMTKNTVTGTSKTRAKVLEESLANLLTQLKKQDANGNYMDINVAIADFNGYYGDGSGGKSGTPYDRTSGDYVKNGTSNGSGYRQPSEAQVYTGSKDLDADAFVHVSELAASYTLNYTSGTNYDYAFDAIYQLGTAIKAANTEERELIVIFMSDGASLQWNYFGTQNTYTKWNNWLAGTWKESDLTSTNLNSTKHSYFYDLNDHDDDGHINEHRMANAIKGSPDNRYEIIRKSTAGLPEGTLVSAGKEYLYTVPGLGATMYTINFDAKQDGQITVDSIDKALASTASDKTGDTQYYYKITTADQLENAFKTIGHAITEAASNIVVTDKITDEYTMIFGIPQSAVDDDKTRSRNQAVQNALKDQELYIEVINYNLNQEEGVDKYERTGDPETLLRLYLKDSDGAIAGGTYSAAKDKNGTAADTLTFVAKGSSKMAYWSVVDASTAVGENDIVITVNGTTYKFMQKGNGTHNVASGAYAFGNIDEKTNMSEDLVIITPYFAYSAATRTLAWTVDKVEEFKEIALRYFLYLNHSAADIATDSETEAGPYPTNEWAYMTYTNHLGHLCRQEFPKPQMTWNGAQVSYVFYLVNAQGQPVNKYGQVVDFANATFVTDVFTESVVWNREGDTSVGTGELSADWLADNLLPENYTIYDPNARYLLNVYEDADGTEEKNQFTIDGGKPSVIATHLTEKLTNVEVTEGDVSLTTTKVYNTKGGQKITGYGTYTSEDQPGINFSNTTVAFAVVWQVALVPDAVVVDYGLDVLINVVQNDFLQNTVSGIGLMENIPENAADMNVGHYEKSMFKTTPLKINGHTIQMEEGKENLIRFHQGDMTFKGAVTFYYESPVRFYENSAWVNQYMYSSVTVIPATTIYYEDDFVTLKTYTENGTKVTEGWNTSSVTASATQAQDRPGVSQISSTLDADNNYGYDQAYSTMSKYSMGGAAMTKVTDGKYATAEFDFYGTGFDIISLTSNTSGTITVHVYEDGDYDAENPDPDKAFLKTSVNNYYGYKYENGNWVATPSADNNALYQVPVLKIGDGVATNPLPYNKYHVVITATYIPFVDLNTKDEGYDFYLDAIRVYNPTGNNDTISNNAYLTDGEAYPKYFEVRDKIIDAGTFTKLSDDAISGIVFIDGTDGKTEVTIKDYTSYGPNNETYLANGQAVAFDLNATANNGSVAKVQMAIKTVGGNGHVVVYGVDDKDKEIDCLDLDIKTATDMYYDITALNGKTVVIKSTGDAIISITNVKVTYTEAQPKTEEANQVFSLRRSSVAAVLATMNVEEAPEEEIPETTVPETPEPEVSETTIPEETEPEFEPSVKVKIKKPTVDEGKKVDVEIRTSADVALITVNGTAVTKYKTDKKTGERTWTYSFKAEKAGDLEVEVIAYSDDGDAAEPVTETVKVVGKPAKKGKGKK